MENKSSDSRGTIEKLATLMVGFLFGSGGLGAGIVYMGKEENTAAGEKIFLYSLAAGGIIFLFVVGIYLYEVGLKEQDKRRSDKRREAREGQRGEDRERELAQLGSLYESLLSTTGTLVNDRIQEFRESDRENEARLISLTMEIMTRGLRDHKEHLGRIKVDQTLMDIFKQSINNVISEWQRPPGSGGGTRIPG